MNIFSGSILYYLIILVLLLLSAGTAYFIYRNEELSNFKRAILVFLRTVSLFLILILLVNPFTEYYNKSVTKPVNAILIDNSLSSRLEKRNETIPNVLKNLVSGNSDIIFYTFGSKLLRQGKTYSEDSAMYYRYSTNLSQTLDDINTIADLSINSFTIVSEGQINEGNNLLNTVKKFNVPFHYVLTGDTIQKKDLVLKTVNYNKQVFVNSLTRVFVTINSYGYSKELRVNLYENGIKVKTNTVTASNDASEYTTSFDLISTEQGIRKYKAEVEAENDEITQANNTEIFYIKYVDNGINILIIAGSPSADVSSLKQALGRTENFKAEYRIQKQSNEYYEGELPDFRNYNAVILNGFPTDITSEEQLSNLSKKLREVNIPLIFINSSNVSFDKLRELQTHLPFIVNDIIKKEFKSNIRITANSTTDKTELLNKFNVYPQSFFYKEAFSVKPNSTVLGLTVQNSEPAIVMDNTSGTKSAGFLGYGYYKWNLNTQGNYNFLQGLISTMINLTVDENTKERFVLKANKDYYAASEDVFFTSYFRDSDPLKKYEVKINISGNGKNEIIGMSQTNRSNFGAEHRIFDKGDYNVKGDLYENGNYLTSTSLKITIGDAVEEYKETRAKEDILKEIAYRTNGKNLSQKDKSEIAELLNTKNEDVKTVSVKTLFRRSFLYLILIIVLLSIEWYIRKRSNLV
ncbi:MAG: hypothetical protein NTY74_04250 [Ignavibacteriae bacterium]|nr:hypothetical protein [Ignavibacteriota bacterium]